MVEHMETVSRALDDGDTGSKEPEVSGPIFRADLAARASEVAGRALAEPLFRLDPRWLYLFAGLALVCATVLIPAMDDLRQAEWNRDRARAVEDFRKQRLANYDSYLQALQSEDPTLVVSLAATQLNLAPADTLAMIDESQEGLPAIDVWGPLEPTLAHVPVPPVPRSRLQAWSTNAQTRTWLLAGGGLCILIGLLPMASVRTGATPAAPTSG